MIEAMIALKNGDVFTVYADTFEGLFSDLEPMANDVVQITGRVTKTNEMRQGKGTRRNENDAL